MLYSVKLLEPHNLTGLCSCPEQLWGSTSILSTRRREAEHSASFLQGNNVAQRALTGSEVKTTMLGHLPFTD